MPASVYQAQLNDFGTDRVTFNDMSVLPLNFVRYDFALDDLDGTPVLDVSALNTAESAIRIEFASMRSPTRSLTTTQRGERDYLRPRERKSKRHREFTSSDSSATQSTLTRTKIFYTLSPFRQSLNYGSSVAGSTSNMLHSK